jgi:hypothetical protein
MSWTWNIFFSRYILGYVLYLYTWKTEVIMLVIDDWLYYKILQGNTCLGMHTNMAERLKFWSNTKFDDNSIWDIIFKNNWNESLNI